MLKIRIKSTVTLLWYTSKFDRHRRVGTLQQTEEVRGTLGQLAYACTFMLVSKKGIEHCSCLGWLHNGE